MSEFYVYKKEKMVEWICFFLWCSSFRIHL